MIGRVHLSTVNVPGRTVVVHRPGMWDPNTASVGEFYSCCYTMMELISLEEECQIAGVAHIMDASHFGLKQLRHVSLTDIKYLTMFWQVRKTMNNQHAPL